MKSLCEARPGKWQSTWVLGCRAQSGHEAIEIFGLCHRGLALVLLDLTMPEMNGPEAFLEMQKINASIPVVLSSGYDVQESGYVHQWPGGFSKKALSHRRFQASCSEPWLRNQFFTDLRETRRWGCT